MFLHNTMLDSSASHNLMPKVIMDNLGLYITRPYKDLYSFGSRKFKCIGLIKDLVVSLHQIPEKSIFRDVVVADVPVKVGMLLSRSWVAKPRATLQRDMSYATIPIFAEQRRLYRENRLACMISSLDCPQNHPIYSIDTDLGSSIFCNELDKEQLKYMVLIKETETKVQVEIKYMLLIQERWRNLHFDGAVGKDDARDGFCIHGPKHENIICSYKLYFDCTNNVSEYETLIQGLRN
jgi:hypothetical protein